MKTDHTDHTDNTGHTGNNRHPMNTAGLLHRMQLATACRAAVALLETEAQRINAEDGQQWYDTAALLNPNEQPAEALDINHEELQFAVAIGIAQRHPLRPHWLRITHLAKLYGTPACRWA